MEDEPITFRRKHPGILVLQASLTIAGFIVIVLSLSIPNGCIFGISSNNPSGIPGVCTFHSVVSFVAFFMAPLGLLCARLVSSARNSFQITQLNFFKASVVCFLIAALWFLDACLVSGYFDMTCNHVTFCQNIDGWNIGGWNVTGAWCSVAVWFFAFLVYHQFSRHSEEGTSTKRMNHASWTVAQAEVVSARSGSEVITLNCKEDNPFTIVVYGANPDGQQQTFVPVCDRVTIDGREIPTSRYPDIIEALQKANVVHQEDVLSVDRAWHVMQNLPSLGAGGGHHPVDVEDGDDFKHSENRLAQERLRQELLEQRRTNEVLQRKLEAHVMNERREAEYAMGRQKAQTEQEQEASKLLQQMMDLEALQQKQHAEKIAGLEQQIAQLKAAAKPGSGATKQVWEGD